MNSSIHALAATLLLAVGCSASATQARSADPGFGACPQFFASAQPPRIAMAELVERLAPRALCYEAFAVLHSGQSKTPVYVAQRISRASLTDARDEKRTDRFFADARLPRRERAQLEDYKGSGFDRGHMAPAADMPSAKAMAQSFSLANMVPQARINNRKPWAGIERATRKYALRARGDIYVISGPVFDSRPRTIGPGKVWVPSHLFKLVYDPAAGRAWVHWIENSDEARAAKPIAYEELVRRTGIEFLPALGASPRYPEVRH